MKNATLCYIFKDNKVLLQKKARGFGEGKWNAPGGKIKLLERPKRAAIREVMEETGLRVRSLNSRGILKFRDEKGASFKVHVFRTSDFYGDARESPEGGLKWFDVGSIPYDDMWDDDRLWVPYILRNEKITGSFLFTRGFKKLIGHKIERG